MELYNGVLTSKKRIAELKAKEKRRKGKVKKSYQKKIEEGLEKK